MWVSADYSHVVTLRKPHNATYTIYLPDLSCFLAVVRLGVYITKENNFNYNFCYFSSSSIRMGETRKLIPLLRRRPSPTV